MKRVVVDHFGGPDVLRVVEADDTRPGPGEVRVRVLASGVSFTDSRLRAGTYFGVPKPPFTTGYELVGVVDQLGQGCTRLREGQRVGALTVWGANAELVCVPEEDAVEGPEDLDPAEVVGLVFPYMTGCPVPPDHDGGAHHLLLGFSLFLILGTAVRRARASHSASPDNHPALTPTALFAVVLMTGLGAFFLIYVSAVVRPGPTALFIPTRSAASGAASRRCRWSSPGPATC
ncbi:2-haloacrylate reductase [Arthrobacter sp. Bi83]|uniref:alcohol dehydrogenase catalytic domain-containing protein n=1 Tax=Arthrobacter sp. Bi83 TaxID=2822353 RepID=UPI001D4D6F55|nr:alcohol dehydrogenase catalytic domain-containing protein [Arthrobacter sp. Bi83]CAH0160404.1 2-haloacrylate reductase [Arthrobacter sp. Bi83]